MRPLARIDHQARPTGGQQAGRGRHLPALLTAPLLTLLLGGCGDTQDAAQARQADRPATPVITSVVHMQTRRTRIEAVGTARALKSVELHAEAAGAVKAVNFEPGDRVAAGTVLVALDARDETLALQLAQVRLDEAQRLFDRYASANRSGERTVPETTVDAARSGLDAARIARDRAQVALDHRYVKAPFDGVVGLTDVDVGDRIEPATVITTLDDRSELLVRFDVPEAYAGQVRAGDPISIETWSAERSHASGEVVDLDSRIDPTTRAFTARARVPNPDDRLRPGMSFRVDLDLAGGSWPVVPEVSVLWGGDGAYVWVNDEGRARRVDVGIVQRGKGIILVDGDLPPGTQVIAEGMQRMRAGIALRALDADTLAHDTRAALAPESPGRAGG